MKGCAPSHALIVRLKRIRKWPKKNPWRLTIYNKMLVHENKIFHFLTELQYFVTWETIVTLEFFQLLISINTLRVKFGQTDINGAI